LISSFISAGGVGSEALENLNSPNWISVSTTCKARHHDGNGVDFCFNGSRILPSQLKPYVHLFISFLKIELLRFLTTEDYE
jgi:hypothetical protein